MGKQECAIRTFACPEAAVAGISACRLGPLYHLTEAEHRHAALREAHRVLRPGGTICAAVISRFASTFVGLIGSFFDEPVYERLVEEDLTTGRHSNPDRRPGWFTTAYFHHPNQIAVELSAAGFATEAVVAIEGPGTVLGNLDAWLDDPHRSATLLRAIRRIEAEPSTLGVSGHILAIGHPQAII